MDVRCMIIALLFRRASFYESQTHFERMPMKRRKKNEKRFEKRTLKIQYRDQ